MIALALALIWAQSGTEDWRQVEIDDGVVVELDVAAVQDRDGLRFGAMRRSSPTSTRSSVMTFEADCKAGTVALNGDARYYESGKLVRTEATPAATHIQQRSQKMAAVVAMVCGL